MDKPIQKNIEKIKNILIVVLFFTTVLLLCFFWTNDSFDVFKMPIDMITTDPEVEIPKVEDVMQPGQVIVGFGKTGNYTEVLDSKNGLWKRAIGQMVQIGKSENLLVEEITAEQYRQVIGLRSIQFRFGYNIPFGEFLSVSGIKRFQALDGIKNMTTLAYSEGSKGSLFVYDQKENIYYHIISGKKSFDGFGTMIDEIERTTYATYYPSSNYFGVETERTVFLPLSLQSDLVNIPCTMETGKGNKEIILGLAESFFGEGFDFVRRMTDSKNRLIYMYGYGQKVFTVNSDGTFEYKEERDEGNYAPIGFYESLQTALRFISVHGTWESLDGTKLSPYLKSVELKEREKRQGYRFVFGMKINGHEVQYQQGEALEIELFGGQVIRYYRNMLELNGVNTGTDQANEREVFPAVNVVAVNYDYINNLYQNTPKNKTTPVDPTSQSFENLAEKITGMKVGYVRMDHQQQPMDITIVPGWILDMEGMQVYFDLYNANPLGYRYTE